MQKIIRNIPSLGVNIVFSIVLLIMCWSLFKQNEVEFSPFIIFGVLIFSISICTLVFLTRNISTKKYVCTISIFYLLLSITIVKLVRSSPISDFQYMLDDAKQLTLGRLGLLLYVTSINLFLLVPVLTNQHLSMMLFSWGAYHLLARSENKNYRHMIFGGLLFALGNIIYPIGILFLIAAGLFLLFFHSTNLKQNLVSPISFISSYLVILYILAFIPVALNISHNPLTNADTGWKFVIGVNKESNGQYSLKDFSKLRQSIVDFNTEEHDRIQQQLIKERTENLALLIPLMNKKNIIIWGSPTDSYVYIPMNNIDRSNINHISFIKLDFIHYVSIMLLSMGFVFIFFFNSQFENFKMKYFQILIIGAFLIYLVTEVQIRYRYFFFPIFIILVAFTLQYMMKPSLSKIKSPNLQT